MGTASVPARFPIGIDTGLIAQQAREAVNKPAVRDLRKSLQPRQLAIGVDRLDYSKGLPERFHGFERYLQRHPEQKGRLTYLQIAPVSRGEVSEYKILRNQLEQIAGHINGNHAEPDWTPLRYVNRNFAHATLTGFYRMARIGLVTPLRDGMNLVAKEFVAAQDRSRPRRAGAVDPGRRGERNEAGIDRQSARPGRRGRCDRDCVRHAACGTRGKMARADGPAAGKRHRRMAQALPAGAGNGIARAIEPGSAPARAQSMSRIYPATRAFGHEFVRARNMNPLSRR